MWIWNQALQWIQRLLSIPATPLSPYENRSRQCSGSTQLHNPGRRQRGGKASYQNHLSAGVSRHFADGNIAIMFTQDGTMVESATNTWFDLAKIQAHDLPRAMREGLHWTESNLDREACYFIRNPRAVINEMLPPHVTCARVYIFRDISREEPLWTAQMTVLCKDLESATHFKFGDLTLDQIAVCEARNKEGKDVYNFSREKRTANINVIYDDMPLEGWWPWPKRPDAGEGDLLLL